mmetsp:Transcript_60937/g.100831  ORF Transcript_60937/g.100831 Transcript_60937/m.100831 type:complete len:181 (+) Transcript_60937:718-1260(+)
MTTDLCWGCSRSFTNLRVRAPNTNSQSFLCFSLQTHASASFLEARGRCNCASKGSVQRQMWTLSDPTSCSDLPTPAAPFLPPVDAPTCHNMQHVLACRCVPILHATDVLIPPATTSHSYPQFTCSADCLWKAIVHDRRKASEIRLSPTNQAHLYEETTGKKRTREQLVFLRVRGKYMEDH